MMHNWRGLVCMFVLHALAYTPSSSPHFLFSHSVETSTPDDNRSLASSSRESVDVSSLETHEPVEDGTDQSSDLLSEPTDAAVSSSKNSFGSRTHKSGFLKGYWPSRSNKYIAGGVVAAAVVASLSIYLGTKYFKKTSRDVPPMNPTVREILSAQQHDLFLDGYQADLAKHFEKTDQNSKIAYKFNHVTVFIEAVRGDACSHSQLYKDKTALTHDMTALNAKTFKVQMKNYEAYAQPGLGSSERGVMFTYSDKAKPAFLNLSFVNNKPAREKGRTKLPAFSFLKGVIKEKAQYDSMMDKYPHELSQFHMETDQRHQMSYTFKNVEYDIESMDTTADPTDVKYVAFKRSSPVKVDLAGLKNALGLLEAEAVANNSSSTQMLFETTNGTLCYLNVSAKKVFPVSRVTGQTKVTPHIVKRIGIVSNEDLRHMLNNYHHEFAALHAASDKRNQLQFWFEDCLINVESLEIEADPSNAEYLAFKGTPASKLLNMDAVHTAINDMVNPVKAARKMKTTEILVSHPDFTKPFYLKISAVPKRYEGHTTEEADLFLKGTITDMRATLATYATEVVKYHQLYDRQHKLSFMKSGLTFDIESMDTLADPDNAEYLAFKGTPASNDEVDINGLLRALTVMETKAVNVGETQTNKIMFKPSATSAPCFLRLSVTKNKLVEKIIGQGATEPHTVKYGRTVINEQELIQLATNFGHQISAHHDETDKPYKLVYDTTRLDIEITSVDATVHPTDNNCKVFKSNKVSEANPKDTQHLVNTLKQIELLFLQHKEDPLPPKDYAMFLSLPGGGSPSFIRINVKPKNGFSALSTGHAGELPAKMQGGLLETVTKLEAKFAEYAKKLTVHRATIDRPHLFEFQINGIDYRILTKAESQYASDPIYGLWSLQHPLRDTIDLAAVQASLHSHAAGVNANDLTDELHLVKLTPTGRPIFFEVSSIKSKDFGHTLDNPVLEDLGSNLTEDALKQKMTTYMELLSHHQLTTDQPHLTAFSANGVKYQLYAVDEEVYFENEKYVQFIKDNPKARENPLNLTGFQSIVEDLKERVKYNGPVQGFGFYLRNTKTGAPMYVTAYAEREIKVEKQTGPEAEKPVLFDGGYVVDEQILMNKLTQYARGYDAHRHMENDQRKVKFTFSYRGVDFESVSSDIASYTGRADFMDFSSWNPTAQKDIVDVAGFKEAIKNSVKIASDAAKVKLFLFKPTPHSPPSFIQLTYKKGPNLKISGNTDHPPQSLDFGDISGEGRVPTSEMEVYGDALASHRAHLDQPLEMTCKLGGIEYVINSTDESVYNAVPMITNYIRGNPTKVTPASLPTFLGQMSANVTIDTPAEGQMMFTPYEGHEPLYVTFKAKKTKSIGNTSKEPLVVDVGDFVDDATFEHSLTDYASMVVNHRRNTDLTQIYTFKKNGVQFDIVSEDPTLYKTDPGYVKDRSRRSEPIDVAGLRAILIDAEREVLLNGLNTESRVFLGEKDGTKSTYLKVNARKMRAVGRSRDAPLLRDMTGLYRQGTSFTRMMEDYARHVAKHHLADDKKYKLAFKRDGVQYEVLSTYEPEYVGDNKYLSFTLKDPSYTQQAGDLKSLSSTLTTIGRHVLNVGKVEGLGLMFQNEFLGKPCFLLVSAKKEKIMGMGHESPQLNKKPAVASDIGLTNLLKDYELESKKHFDETTQRHTMTYEKNGVDFVIVTSEKPQADSPTGDEVAIADLKGLKNVLDRLEKVALDGNVIEGSPYMFKNEQLEEQSVLHISAVKIYPNQQGQGGMLPVGRRGGDIDTKDFQAMLEEYAAEIATHFLQTDRRDKFTFVYKGKRFEIVARAPTAFVFDTDYKAYYDSLDQDKAGAVLRLPGLINTIDTMASALTGGGPGAEGMLLFKFNDNRKPALLTIKAVPAGTPERVTGLSEGVSLYKYYEPFPLNDLSDHIRRYAEDLIKHQRESDQTYVMGFKIDNRIYNIASMDSLEQKRYKLYEDFAREHDQEIPAPIPFVDLVNRIEIMHRTMLDESYRLAEEILWVEFAEDLPPVIVRLTARMEQ